ncbi:TPA: hypothetical protein ACNMQ1_005067 [Klebsiella pneumoniae]
MAIHAKTSGLLIGGKIIEETERNWIFQAMDNKRPTVVSKYDAKNKVFDGESAVDDAINWIESSRGKK